MLLNELNFSRKLSTLLLLDNLTVLVRVHEVAILTNLAGYFFFRILG